MQEIITAVAFLQLCYAETADIILVRSNPEDVVAIIGLAKAHISQDGAESLVGNWL